MVDEPKKVEQKPEVEANPIVESVAPPVPEVGKPEEAAATPQADPDIVAIKEELNELKQKTELSEEKARKFDQVSQAITGKEHGFDKVKFFEDLAEDPEGTLDEFISSKTKPLKEKLKEKELKEADNLAFTNLRTKHPDFDEVINSGGKYLYKEDIEATEDLPNRMEIRFALAKARRDAEMVTKKSEETNAMNKAKAENNKTSITERPTGSAMETAPPEGDTLDTEISSAIKKGDWNKGDGWSKKDEKIFEQFNRDVYGIKK